MGKYSLDLKEYARLAREVAAESCVLLKMIIIHFH